MIEEILTDKKYHKGDAGLRDNFLERIHSIIMQAGKDYISVIKNSGTADKAKGTAWLKGIVDNITLKTKVRTQHMSIHT